MNFFYSLRLCVGVLWEKGNLVTCTWPEKRKASTLWPSRSSSSPNCKRLRWVLILRMQNSLKTAILETYLSGWAPAQKRDRNPVSSETPKHSQTLWLLLWRDQVSWNVLPVTLKYFSHPKWYFMRKIASQDLPYPRVRPTRRDVQVSAEATQAKVSTVTIHLCEQWTTIPIKCHLWITSSSQG